MTQADETAFPVKWTDCNGVKKIYGGLTKREYFAAMAMSGILAGSREKYVVNDDVLHGGLVAAEALHCADKLIEQLNN